MLSKVRIRGLGVIDDAELDLAPGLNVITGETGAGKTMVVSGVGLLLGARADSALVRPGASGAVVEGEVDVAATHPAARRAASAGGEVSDGLVLVRTVGADGRSRAHVGGRAAPVAVLAEIGELLVAVHGQADQWRLRRPEEHRMLLDGFGGARLLAARTAYQEAHQAWVTTRSRLAELRHGDADRIRRREMLRTALAEVEAVGLQPGEEDQLLVEEQRLAHAEDLRTAAETAHAALAGTDDPAQTADPVTALIARATHALGQVSEHDPTLAALRAGLADLGYLAADIAGDLASYATGVEVDPVRLAWVQERRAQLGPLLRRYGPTSQEVLDWAAAATQEMLLLDDSHETISSLQARETDLRQRVGSLGSQLSGLRAEVGQTLSEQVAEELAHLAMGQARVHVRIGHRPSAEGVPLPDAPDAPVTAWNHGLDEVELQLAANPGAALRSVTKGASGGELSRVMLALEVVCARGEVPTYVFDEVDAGVAGAAALDLGARLARLGEQAQVIVVTHLGQVAAFADRHLVVHKSSQGQVTASGVHQVVGDARVGEIARMLGGVADSEAALRHARELLEEHAPQRVAR